MLLEALRTRTSWCHSRKSGTTGLAVPWATRARPDSVVTSSGVSQWFLKEPAAAAEALVGRGGERS